MPNSRARRRFVFSLRTLFVLLTALGVWLGWELRVVQARKDMEPFFREWEVSVIYAGEGAECGHPEKVSWVRAAMGDRPVAVIHCPWPLPADQLARVKSLFPEADTDWIFPQEARADGS